MKTFEEHFKLKKRDFHRQAYAFLKDHHYAEDAIQETYYRGIKYYNTFQQGTDFNNWMGTIFFNVLKQMKKDIQNNGVTMEVDPHKFPVVVFDVTPEAIVKFQELIERKFEKELDKKCLLLWLHYGYGAEEVSENLGVTRTRMYSLWKKLKKEVLEEDF